MQLLRIECAEVRKCERIILVNIMRKPVINWLLLSQVTVSTPLEILQGVPKKRLPFEVKR